VRGSWETSSGQIKINGSQIWRGERREVMSPKPKAKGQVFNRVLGGTLEVEGKIPGALQYRAARPPAGNLDLGISWLQDTITRHTSHIECWKCRIFI